MIKTIKRVFVWIFVLIVLYVVAYGYLHPNELVYTVKPYANNYDAYENGNIPLEPLVKETNPFVYFFLKYQAVFFILVLVYVFADYKRTLKSLQNLQKSIKRFIKIKD